MPGPETKRSKSVSLSDPRSLMLRTASASDWTRNVATGASGLSSPVAVPSRIVALDGDMTSLQSVGPTAPE